MNRAAGVWFGVAGALTLTLSLLAVSLFDDAAYYDAESFGDYFVVVSLTSIFLLTGVALIVLWRDPPVRRGSVFILLAGPGAVASGLDNLLEDVFSVESAVWAFFGGRLAIMASLIVAGLAALTVDSPRRWSGLFLLLGVPGALTGFGLVIMGVSWILFGLWLVYQRRAFIVALSIAAVPLVAAGIYVYL
jgi:hypothetical protein